MNRPTPPIFTPHPSDKDQVAINLSLVGVITKSTIIGIYDIHFFAIFEDVNDPWKWTFKTEIERDNAYNDLIT